MFSKAAVPRIALLATALGGVFAVSPASAFPPGAPGTPVLTDRSTDSVSWVWTSALDADQYQVFVASAMGTPILTTSATGFTHSGLGPNGLSSIFVRGLNLGEDGPFSGQGTAYSSAATPSGLTVSSVTSVYVFLTWNGAGNPVGTFFDLQKSLDGSSFSTHSTYTVTSATTSGLAANTTYYFRVRAFNNETVATAFTSDVATRTAPTGGVALPGPASGLGGVVESTAEISWSWGAVSGATGYRVYLGTKTYELLASTGSPAFLHRGLRPGDSSGIVVSAVNATGEGPQSQPAFKRTSVQPPTGTAVVTVTANSISLSWNANGNPSGTNYEVQRATEGGVFSSIGTFNTTGATSSGLASSTTYEFRVRAQNLDGLQTSFDSTVTTTTSVPFPGVPGNPSTTFVSTQEVVWSWSPASDAANYEVRLATKSGELLAFPAVPAFTHAVGPNGLSSIIVRGANVNGVGLFTSTRTAHTLARAPIALTVSTVTSLYAVLSWDGDGNPPGTTYLVEKSTENGPFEAHSTFTVTSATVSILVPLSTYTFRVLALNDDIIPTAYSGSVTTVTAATGGVPPPGAAGTPSTVLVSTGDVSWTWSGADYADSYEVVLATNTTEVLATVLTTAFFHLDLGVNELSSIRVRGLNGTGPGSLSNAGSAYSLARTPSGLGFTSVSNDTVELFWNQLDNPVGTQYEVEGSTEGGEFASLAGIVFGAATITDLEGLTTYQFRVRAYNADNVPTPYTATASTQTLPPPPPAPGTPTALVLSSGDVEWSWTSSTAALSFEVYLATDVFSLLASPATTHVTLSGFGPNDVSAIAVRGVNAAGAGELSAGATAYTYALPPTALTGVAVASTSITLNWTPTGNPTDMTYELQRATDASSFLTYSTYSFAAATVEALIPSTTYSFRVRAANGGGVLTGFSGTLSTGTAPPLPGIPGTPGPVYTSTGVITWAWTPGTDTLTYELVLATNTAEVLAAPSVSSATLTLTPNTLMSVRARGLNGGGSGPLSVTGQGYSLAMPPIALTASAVTVSSITLDWGSNGNPAGTNFEVQLSSGGGPFGAVATVAAAFVDLSGFSSSTAHNFRVRALNGDGVTSDFSGTVSTTTLGLPPGVSGTPSAFFLSSAAVTWTWSPAADALTYQVYLATKTAELLATPAVSSFTLTLGVNQPSAIVVRGVNATGAGPLSPSATVYTLAGTPTGLGFADVTANSADLTWTAGGNVPDTLYELEASTGGPFSSAGQTTALGASVSALSSSTAYSFRVRALNADGVPGAYSATASTNTDGISGQPLPGAAGTPATVFVSTDDVVWSWSAASDADRYKVYPASNPAVLVALPTASSVTFRPMGPNALSAIAVRGANDTGNGPLSAAATAYTLAFPPASLAFDGVHFTSVTVSWDPGSNPNGTEYRLELSTDGVSFAAHSTTTLAAFTATGLLPDTTAALRVRAVNGDGVLTAYSGTASTRTQTVLPGVPGTPAAVFFSSASVTWSWSAAADAASYLVLRATNTSELLAAPAVSSVSFALGPNVLSGIVVRGVNGLGSGPLSAAASGHTLAATPSGIGFPEVTANSAEVSWGSGGNPEGTLYELEASTGAGFTGAANTSVPNASLASLSSATSYSFRVRAVNGDGVPGSYSSTASTQTRGLGGQPLPGTPGTPSTVFVSSADVSWVWGAASDADRYKVYPASSTGVQLASPTATAVVFTGMAPNTPSGIVVRGVNDAGNGSLSSAATAYTLAVPPASLAVDAVYFTSVSLSWSGGLNPAGTEYGVESSTDGVAFTPFSTTTAAALVVAGLATDSDSTFRVRAANADGVPTTYSSSASTRTLVAVPMTPGPPTPVVLSTAEVSWTWGPSDRADAYDLVLATKTSEVVASTEAATVILRGYSPNSPSAIYVRGTNVFGLGPLSVSATAYTLAMTPSGLTGVDAASTTMHLTWSDGGNAPGTLYTIEIDAADSGFVSVGNFFVAEATVAALSPATTYQFRVLARNGDNVPTGYSSSLSTGTAPPFPGVPGTPTATFISEGAVTWSWTAAADATSYQAYAASNIGVPIASPAVSSFTLTQGANLPSGVVVRGVNAAGAGPLSASATVYTLANPPATLGVTGVTATSVDLVWSGAGNPGGTSYHIESSTNGGATFAPSGNTAAAAATISALSSSTAYDFRIRASNGSGVFTTYSNVMSTQTDASVGPLPGLPGKPFTAFVSSNDVSWVWAGASDAVGYKVFLASSPTTLLGTPATNVFTLLGLGPNVPSAIVVAGTNSDGSGPLSPAATAYTLARAPVSMVLGSVGASSIAFSWSAGGNPGGTRYSVEESLDGVFFVPFTTTTALSLTAVSLTSNTLYAFRVLAVNGDGLDSAYSNAVTTTTLSPQPGLPGTPTFVSASTGDVVWSWSPAFQATAYQVYLATKTSELLAMPATTSYVRVVGPNQLASVVVRATNPFGASALSAAATAYSWAMPPSALSLTSVSSSAVVMTWSANGNPAATVFELQLSSDGAAYAAFSTYTVAGATASLAASTTCFFRVRARNTDLVTTAFASAVSTRTLPPMPGTTGTPAAASVSTGGVAWSWTTATDAASYRVSLASKTAEVLANPTANVYTKVLGPNEPSGVVVRALNATGSGPLSPSATVYSWAMPPSTLALTAVSSAAVSMMWSANGNPAGTVYELQTSTDGALYTAFSTYTVAGATASLPASTTYFFQVRARNADLVNSAFASAVSTRTLPPLPGTPGTPSTTFVSTGGVVWGWSAALNATSYQVLLATKTAETLSTPATNAYHEALGPNEPSAVVVKGVNATGTGPLSASATAYSLAKAPASLAATTVSSAAVGLTWTANGNPAGTVYELQTSTDGALYASYSTYTAVAATVPALSASTTYFFQVRARNGDSVNTAFASAVSTRTLPPLPGTPGTPAATSVSTGGVAWGWTAAANASSYQVALASKTSEVLSSPATNAFVRVLGPNEPAGIVVRAVNVTGSGPLSASATVYTWAMPPGALSFTAVSSASAGLAWTANGNPAGTLFEVQRSTDGALYASLSTYTALGTSATALSASTTYYFRVRALNADLVTTAFTSAVSTRTMPPAPGLPGTPTAVSASTGDVVWTWTGAADAVSYQVALASKTSETLASPPTTSYTRALGPNEPAGIVVRGVNASGAGALSAPATAYSLAMPPTTLAVGSVSSASVSLSWSANGNPAGTIYEIQFSPDGASYLPHSTAAGAGSTASGLAAATTYYFQVRARNGDLVDTVFTSVVSTLTLSPAPGQPGTPVGSVLGVSSVSWSWSAALYAAGYKVYTASSPALPIASPASEAYVQIALPPNTAAGLFVAGINPSGLGVLSEAATVYTLAAPPSGTTASAVHQTSATVSWSLNGNPAGTSAGLERSTDGASFAPLLSTTSLTFTMSDLLVCSSYWVRLRNSNGDGVPTAYDGANLLTRPSTPSAPGGLGAEPTAGNRVSLSWTPSGSESVIAYRLYWDGGTGTVSYAAPLAVVPASMTTHQTGVLASSVSYRFALRAFNRCGIEEGNTGVLASAPSLATLTGVKAAPTSPRSGQRVKGDRVTVAADRMLGAASEVQSVLFQYKPSSSSVWLDIPAAGSSVNPDTSEPYFMHWNADGLGAAVEHSFDLRAVAFDVSGTSDAAPSAVTVSVVPTAAIAYDVSEGLVGGKVVKSQVLDNTVTTTLRTGGTLPTRLSIPAGALASGAATVTVENDPAGLPPAPTGAESAGSAVGISLGGQIFLSNGKTAAVTLGFPDLNGDGLVDGTGLRTDRLVMYSAATLAGPWVRDFGSSVDTTEHTVTGNTPHFSFFALFAVAAADLDAVRVYPVPYMPNGGNADQGTPYAVGNPNSGIVFDNLPNSVVIKIYTVTGQRVVQFSTDSSGGKVQWDVKNDRGQDVASGGYIAVITSPNAAPLTKRILILR